MPRYYFNMSDHGEDVDNEGQELAGPEDARVAAVVFAGDYLSEHPDLVWDGRRFAVEVRDECGKVLLSVVVTAEDPSDPRGPA